MSKPVFFTIFVVFAALMGAAFNHFGKIGPTPSFTILTGHAEQKDCSDRFAAGLKPVVPESMSDRSIFICNEAAGILYSRKSRTAVYSAEHLTAARIRAARQMVRVNRFHYDPATGTDGPRLDDFKGSSYDRGHLSPSGDQPDDHAQEASFSLANIIPQNPNNNRHLWANIEEAVRDYVADNNELYVITGPIFDGVSIGFINGRVAVPTRIFKAVLDPSTRRGGVYIVWNQTGNAYGVISYAAFKRITGIDLFPALDDNAKNALPEIPVPSHASSHEIED